MVAILILVTVSVQVISATNQILYYLVVMLKVLKLHSTLGKSASATSSLTASASGAGEFCLVAV